VNIYRYISMLRFVLFVIIGSFSTTQNAADLATEMELAVTDGDPWCLYRTVPGATNSKGYQYYKPINQNSWVTQKSGFVHSDHNLHTDCQVDGEFCNVEFGDVFTVTSSGTNKYNYIRRRADFDATDEKAAVRPEGGGKFLSGDIAWDKDSGGRVYVLYYGKADCRFPSKGGHPEIKYEISAGVYKKCNSYSIEIYPDDDGTWDKFKPDFYENENSKADWQPGICRTTTPLEPGGGDGHDPP
jgi:hypothetical protein